MTSTDAARSISLVIRFTLLTLTLIVLAVGLYHFRLALASGLIPFLQIMVEGCEQRFAVAEFTVRTGGSEQLFHLRLVADQPVLVLGRVLPGMDVSATTLVTHLLLDLWIYGAVIAAGVALVPLRRARLIPALLAGGALLCWLDIPLVLLGSIEGLLVQNLAPQQLDTNPWVWWSEFLTQGGRMVLALGLGVGVLVAAGYSAKESSAKQKG